MESSIISDNKWFALIFRQSRNSLSVEHDISINGKNFPYRHYHIELRTKFTLVQVWSRNPNARLLHQKHSLSHCYSIDRNAPKRSKGHLQNDLSKAEPSLTNEETDPRVFIAQAALVNMYDCNYREYSTYCLHKLPNVIDIDRPLSEMGAHVWYSGKKPLRTHNQFMWDIKVRS